MSSSIIKHSSIRALQVMLTCLLWGLVISTWSPVQAKTSSPLFEQQRLLFKQAESALVNADHPLFEDLLYRMAEYPVIGYLEYDAFIKNLHQVSSFEVKQFLNKYKDYPFTNQLLSQWLRVLAKREDWYTYLTFYDGRSSTKYKCLALTAKIKTGQLKNINAQLKKLWLNGKPQPEACDIPFKYLIKTSNDAPSLIWQRIEKAFSAGRPSLAVRLAKQLGNKEQKIVDDWRQAHINPAQRLPLLAKRTNTPLNRQIILHALHRLVRQNSLEAKALWESINPKFTFSVYQQQKLNKRIAMSSAYQHKPEAKKLLQDLPLKLKSDKVSLWLAKIQLRDEDWIGLIKTIKGMPAALKGDAEWVYWLARAYESAGHQVKATDIYTRLAPRSSYYGFLAADKINADYTIEQQTAAVHESYDEQQLMDKNIHLLRARELFFLKRPLDARREWFKGIKKLSQLETKQAASLALKWKWYDNAIKTVAKTAHRKDYSLRFPMPYKPYVMLNVKQKNLDSSVIYGVIRRESLFDPMAKSRVGALGLMQLMPATAKDVASSLGLKNLKQNDILNIGNNIKLGTSYFRSVLNRFDENVSLAAAAYNAGPSNVKKWLPEQGRLPADLWVETIPFNETRKYVKAVLAYATIFDKHQGKKIQISSRMNDVKASY